MNGARRRGRNGTAVKIVVTGPFSAGKTTLIRTISEITVLSTERGITDETARRKAQTTVALDFGRITIDRDLVLYLFGTPGQDRFDFMWEILGEGMLGYVVVLDGTVDDPGGDARTIYDAFRKMAPTLQHVVAVNRGSGLDPDAETELRTNLGLAPHVPIVPFDATDRESVKSVLLALLHEVLDALERAPAAV
ncbi:MAG TPA: ATP/GTP-binding protein [Mycobacteriales bacterium]|nr:ATP/GTP-binding protein [Mycobacteriales bacterium]